jgi:CBS domain-containing protein
MTEKAVVRDVMSAHPVSVRTTSSFKELVGRLREFAVSGFPVLDAEGKLVGVVSEADMLAKEALAGRSVGIGGVLARLVHRGQLRKAEGITAGDLMTSPAVTVGPDDTVEYAARQMHARGLRRLPVMDADGRLVGVVSQSDVLAVYGRADEEVRAEIIGQVIPRLSEPSWYMVRVEQGIVTLEGSPETVKIGHEVVARVRRVQGVVAVRDRLVYPLPPEVTYSFPRDM